MGWYIARRVVVMVACGSLVLTSLAGCAINNVRTDVVIVNAGEPQSSLIPTNTSEFNGARILDRLFAGLMSYDAKGAVALEVAQSIETTDNINYRIILKRGWTFSDGSAVTARSFVNAWNYGALGTNAQLEQTFFSPIVGFDEVTAPKPASTTMSGLRVVNDHEFTMRLKAPTIDFTLRLAYSAFYPLPDAALKDMTAFGQHPIGNGPYKFADGRAWQHNVKLDLVSNPGYHGNRVPRNKGLRFVFYANLDAAYADLLSSNLDVLDTIPPSVLPVYRKDLGDRAITALSAANQTLATPLWLPHFGGEEGRLRRLALSAAINRPQICQQIFFGARVPARDFTASSVLGYDPNIDGNDVLNFDPDRARRLWLQADAISKWTGRYAIAYSIDGGHQEWVDAVANSIKNVLGIDAVGAPQPTFAGFRGQIINRTITTAFRAGRLAGVPSLLEFFDPLEGADDVGYSSPDFDAALAAAQAAPSFPQAFRLASAAQRILLGDMYIVPLWYTVTAAGRSPAVSDVTLTWNGLPDYENIVKA
jgi:oligopeptide transport system substrate-binding protein